MLLTDIFDQLCYGEFAHLGIVDTETYQLKDKEVERLIGFVNLGLTELHKRFMLKRRKLIFDPGEFDRANGRLRYVLDSEHALVSRSNRGRDYYYIDDLAEISGYGEGKFTDDIIEIIKVEDEYGNVLPLNVEDTCGQLAVTTPNYNTLRFSHALPEKGKFIVTYQANHPRVELASPDGVYSPGEPKPSKYSLASLVEIDLPYHYLDALLYFIASRMITPIASTMNGQPQEAVQYAQKFEQACQALMMQGSDVQTAQENHRFNLRGFI